jgi:hypothetical protein
VYVSPLDWGAATVAILACFCEIVKEGAAQVCGTICLLSVSGLQRFLRSVPCLVEYVSPASGGAAILLSSEIGLSETPSSAKADFVGLATDLHPSKFYALKVTVAPKSSSCCLKANARSVSTSF